MRVVLPLKSSVVGFGANGAVYVARTDDDDLQYLQRFRLNPWHSVRVAPSIYLRYQFDNTKKHFNTGVTEVTGDIVRVGD